MKICSSIPAYSTPDHDGTITITVMLTDVVIMETFTFSSPHSVPPVCKVQKIPELTFEQNWNPIVLCPSDRIFNPVQSLPPVLNSQKDSNTCPFRVESCIVKPIPYRLSGHIHPPPPRRSGGRYVGWLLSRRDDVVPEEP
jgi:hypothetical protein